MNYFELNTPLATDSLRDELCAISKHLDYALYVTNKGNNSGLYYASVIDSIRELSPEVNKLIRRFNTQLPISQIIFIKFIRGGGIAPHIDDSLSRSTCITWALSPEIGNFAPVLYYKDYGDPDPITVKYTTTPLVINTRTVHAVINNDYDRYSFQLGFSVPITELYQLYLENTLFNNGS